MLFYVGNRYNIMIFVFNTRKLPYQYIPKWLDTLISSVL